jgi:O-palmitoleoyl-L-serine hydrolase
VCGRPVWKMTEKCDYRKYFLSDSKSQCIDGTRAVYYLRIGSGTGQSKWHIHFEGGGWCYDLESCHYRSTTNLGSSKSYEECLSYSFTNSAYFSSNETANPLLHNFNVVFVRYCDGSSFAGNDMQKYQVK